QSVGWSVARPNLSLVKLAALPRSWRLSSMGFTWSRAHARALLSWILLAGIVGGGRPAQAHGREGEPRTSAPAEIQVLEVGQPIEGEVAGDRSRFYQVTLAAGQYMDVVWELRRSAPLLSRLSGPDGERLYERDAGKHDGREGILWIAEKPGDYRIQFATVAPDRPASYVVRLVALRAAAPDDRLRVRAQELSRAAHELASGTEASK